MPVYGIGVRTAPPWCRFWVMVMPHAESGRRFCARSARGCTGRPPDCGPEGSCGGKRGVLDQHEPFVRFIYAYSCHVGRGQPVKSLMGTDEIVMNYRQLDARRVILL